MAVPKKGSRIITVEGVKYRWRVRHKPTYCQGNAWHGITVSVELDKEPRTVLVVELPYVRPDNWIREPAIPVLPSVVEHWIRVALQKGWQPNVAGETFCLDGTTA
jgi:hypothetical protein